MYIHIHIYIYIEIQLAGYTVPLYNILTPILYFCHILSCWLLVSACSTAQEEVAMAAAADTTARIRAAAERALAPRGAVPAPPWAVVPMAPMYSWQPYVPMMPSMGPLGMGSMGSMGLKSDEKKHREELQHELLG